MNYPHLFEPGRIGSMEVKNRIVMPALEVLGSGYNGEMSDLLIRYYEERAKAGVGLIVTAYASVDEEFCPSFEGAQLKLTHPRHISGMSRLARTIHKYDSKVWVQIYMAGRQAVPSSITGKRMVAPSSIGYSLHDQIPEAMTIEEIHAAVKKFGTAAKYLQDAGIDGVEVLAAGGYLINQFLSPYSNKRTDEYGGSYENRVRFLLEIIQEIRERCGRRFPISVRFCGDEFTEGGYGLDEGVRIAKTLEAAGVDCLSVNNANQEKRYLIIEPTTIKAGWKSYIAKTIKEAVSIPVIATDVIKMPDEAERFLTEGVMDFAAVGRANFADPEWARKAYEGRPEDIRPCIGCLYCLDQQALFCTSGCAVNTRSVREQEFPEPKRDLTGKNIAVIGAGPAGMEAAIVCAQRGAEVTVFEKHGFMGGDAELATRTPDKEVMKRLIRFYETQAKKFGIHVHLNTEGTVERVMAVNPYAVFVAVGGRTFIPPVKGVDEVSYLTADDALAEGYHVEGKKVAVVGGGMTGIEIAENYAVMGNDVTVVEMQGQLAPEANRDSKVTVLENFEKYGTKVLTSHALEELKEDRIIVENMENGEHVEIKADIIVLSLGKRPQRALGEKLKELYEKVYFVGDARQCGRIANAVHTGYQAAYVLE